MVPRRESSAAAIGAANFSARNQRLFEQTLVVAHDQVAVDLLHQIERDAHGNQQTGSAVKAGQHPTYVERGGDHAVVERVEVTYAVVGEAEELRLTERAGQPELTAREMEVLSSMAHGMRNKEIAGRLNVCEETIQVHVRNIFAKLKVHDRTAAVTLAVKRGLIRLP